MTPSSNLMICAHGFDDSDEERVSTTNRAGRRITMQLAARTRQVTLHGVKILLADDHQIMRDGLRAILAQSGFVVIGEASTGREAIAQAHALRPDLIIMDISMPDLNGIDATRRLASELPSIKVIGVSGHADSRYSSAMLEAGASGFVLKQAASKDLIAAVPIVMSGMTFVSPAVGQAIDSTRGARGSSNGKSLSPREREVLQLIAEGKASKEIASSLDIALPTVETHRRQLMDKLSLRTIAELTKYAIREGLTSLEPE